MKIFLYILSYCIIKTIGYNWVTVIEYIYLRLVPWTCKYLEKTASFVVQYFVVYCAYSLLIPKVN